MVIKSLLHHYEGSDPWKRCGGSEHFKPHDGSAEPVSAQSGFASPQKVVSVVVGVMNQFRDEPKVEDSNKKCALMKLIITSTTGRSLKVQR